MEDVTLNVADKGEEISMEFDSLTALAKLLKLAGVSCEDDGEIEPEDQGEFDDGEIETDDHGAFDVDIDDQGSISIADENADYDYGINPVSDKGHRLDIDPYKYQGDAELDTRYVPSKSADNPMPRIREGKRFLSYLNEIECYQEADQDLRLGGERYISETSGAVLDTKRNVRKWYNSYSKACHIADRLNSADVSQRSKV